LLFLKTNLQFLRKKMKYFVFLFIIYYNIFACTSAIISGKITANGRPIIWKHRDSDFEKNIVIYETKTKYKFIGIANSNDTVGNEIWMGVNEAGLAIINTASYNLENCNSCNGREDEEGFLMRYVLANCKSVEEFEKIISEKGNYGVYANFGVIDAYGNGAYYEFNGEKYIKFDVNDEKVAPNGYIIRTNFSVTGDSSEGKGYIRYDATYKLFENELRNNKITPEFLFQKASRNLVHGLTNIDLNTFLIPKNLKDKKLFPFRDFVPRNSTVSVFVCESVNNPKEVSKINFWINIGNPLITPVIPFSFDNLHIPDYLKYNSNYKTCELNAKSLCLKSKLFPVNIENGPDYIDLAYLNNNEKTGVINIIEKYENKILNLNREDKNYYEEVYKIINEFYNNY